MWPWLLERCADFFGTTRRRTSRLAAVAIGLAMHGLLAILLALWGLRGALPLIVVIVIAALAAREAAAARDGLWRAATLPLDHPAQRPAAALGALSAPTAMALKRLAVAVDATRRGRYLEAAELVAVLDRDLLREDETRLLEAVRAMIAAGLGDTRRVAQLAVLALPTGSDEFDAWLGRALVRDAWNDSARLASIEAAWSRAGIEAIGDGTLPRLRRLMRIRASGADLDQVSPRDAQDLSDEARAVGDDDLAVALDAVGRRSKSYR